MDADAFRVAFPEFADPSTYPDASVRFWLDAIVGALDEKRWGSFHRIAAFLFTAHNLTLARQAATSGGGGSSGLLTNKSVGQVSAAYDTLSVSFKDAGHWNATAYGRQFFHYLRLFGIGGRQL